MELIHYVSIVAQFLTYASFLSGAKVCYQIHKQKSCAKLSPAPFLAGLNCTALWLRYGFIADEWEIVAVNIVGIVCQVIYFGFFFAYTNQKARLTKQVFVLVGFLLLFLWAIQSSPDPLFVGGSMASISSLLACASPLVTIQDVIKTKCVASLPFPIIASSFVVTLSWLTFGFLKGDNFIIFSNLVAVSLNAGQLILFIIYPSKYPYEKLSPSNRKSYDLIKLLNSEEDSISDDYEIDTNEDYKGKLTAIMGQIYSEREKMSKMNAPVMLSFHGIR